MNSSKKHNFCQTINWQLPAVPREKRLVAYVGTLAKETTVDELTAFLKNEGLDDITCRWLQAENGRQLSTAAFLSVVPKPIVASFMTKVYGLWEPKCEIVSYNS